MQNEAPTEEENTAGPSASADRVRKVSENTACPDAPDMRREEERLKSFDKWPLSFLSPELLAKNGFYYLGLGGDEVRCAFCKVEILKWVEGDDPAKDHQLWGPQCPFLRCPSGSGNIPLGSQTAVGGEECGVRAPPSPVHPQYASEAARLRTFEDWPRSMKQKPEELAEAGFFYTGNGDKTLCFYCDGGLKDWKNDDVPWEQHARWYDHCGYVQLLKGREYVQKVISEACSAPKEQKETPDPAPPAEKVNSEKKENLIEDTKL